MTIVDPFNVKPQQGEANGTFNWSTFPPLTIKPFLQRFQCFLQSIEFIYKVYRN